MDLKWDSNQMNVSKISFMGLFIILALNVGCQVTNSQRPNEAIVVPINFNEVEFVESEEGFENDPEDSKILDDLEDQVNSQLQADAKKLLDRRLQRLQDRRLLASVLEQAQTIRAKEEISKFNQAVSELDLNSAESHLKKALEADPSIVGGEVNQLNNLRLANAHRYGELNIGRLPIEDRSKIIQGHLQAADLLLAHDKTGEAYEHVTACLKVIRKGREEKLHDAAISRIRKQMSSQVQAITSEVNTKNYAAASERLTQTLDSISELKAKLPGFGVDELGIPQDQINEIMGLIQQGDFSQAEIMAESNDISQDKLDTLRQRIKNLKEALQSR